MDVKEKVIKMIQKDSSLISTMLKDFCPGMFGISCNFEEKVQYACTRGCNRCWNRNEDEVKRDEEIWKDYENTDFNKVDRDKWLKKWNVHCL